MKVCIIGGTGFIGYHAVRACIAAGHGTTVVARGDPASFSVLPEGVRYERCDICEASPEEQARIFRTHDVVVFAAGADDRIVPPIPAYDFFYRENVLACLQTMKASASSGVRRVVIVSSYFLHFDRLWPDEKLARYHPYIRSRQEQAVSCLAATTPDLDVVFVELPYVVGATPGRTSLWRPLVRYAGSSLPLFYTAGGTAFACVSTAGQALLAAAERGQAGKHYTLCDENLSWRQWLEAMASAQGKERRCHTLPTRLVWPGMWLLRAYLRLRGRESGLDPGRFLRLQTRSTFVDPEPTRQALGLTGGDVQRAIVETVKSVR
jgi:dihydroflavonol-4-reductase